VISGDKGTELFHTAKHISKFLTYYIHLTITKEKQDFLTDFNLLKKSKNEHKSQ